MKIYSDPAEKPQYVNFRSLSGLNGLFRQFSYFLVCPMKAYERILKNDDLLALKKALELKN